ncbi:MAG TPA: hypothetical protein DEB21_08175 [Rhodospirillaceae bacterium]|nr:hypothetical protein [Magnetovibrio sp.]UTW52965.1 hypothetical protein KFF05_06285 [bacterium SCSIO 12827]HBT41981.1 hypothetical protein [Rhodospirillaceae bacterium]|tara:strand:- start:400 stop:606 length:207 start_codon:yes stop_codon:yes gene_type:complete
MRSRVFEQICGILGTAMVAAFVLGLAWGISHGFAGFWGGLPFWVISLGVLALVLYDLWDSTLKKTTSD